MKGSLEDALLFHIKEEHYKENELFYACKNNDSNRKFISRLALNWNK